MAAQGTVAVPHRPTDRLVLGRDADLPEGIKKPGGYALRSLATIVVLLLIFLMWVLAMRYLPLPRLWLLLSPVSLLVLGLGLIVRGIVRSRQARGVVGELPKKLDAGSGRLQAVGKARTLAPLVKLGELRDEQFEPIVIFAPRVWPMPKVANAALVVTAVAVVALMQALRYTTTLPIPQMGWLTVMLGLAAGTGVQVLFWPTYLRITPGRLDVMRFTLGGSRPEMVTVNLRNARVLAHMGKTALLIKPAGPGGVTPAPVSEDGKPAPEWVLLNLRGVWRSAETVHAVCCGAVSTAPGAPLPDDRLVG